MLSWIVTRHVLFCKVIASTYWELPAQVEFGWWPERSHWFTKEVHTVFFSLLVILEVSIVTHPWCNGTANLSFVLGYPVYLVVLDI
jgi:acyl-CoA-dependent ceramide synthase